MCYCNIVIPLKVCSFNLFVLFCLLVINSLKKGLTLQLGRPELNTGLAFTEILLLRSPQFLDHSNEPGDLTCIQLFSKPTSSLFFGLHHLHFTPFCVSDLSFESFVIPPCPLCVTSLRFTLKMLTSFCCPTPSHGLRVPQERLMPTLQLASQKEF